VAGVAGVAVAAAEEAEPAERWRWRRRLKELMGEWMEAATGARMRRRWRRRRRRKKKTQWRKPRQGDAAVSRR
jgi:hypothetical protein